METRGREEEGGGGGIIPFHFHSQCYHTIAEENTGDIRIWVCARKWSEIREKEREGERRGEETERDRVSVCVCACVRAHRVAFSNSLCELSEEHTLHCTQPFSRAQANVYFSC